MFLIFNLFRLTSLILQDLAMKNCDKIRCIDVSIQSNNVTITRACNKNVWSLSFSDQHDVCGGSTTDAQRGVRLISV